MFTQCFFAKKKAFSQIFSKHQVKVRKDSRMNNDSGMTISTYQLKLRFKVYSVLQFI